MTDCSPCANSASSSCAFSKNGCRASLRSSLKWVSSRRSAPRKGCGASGKLPGSHGASLHKTSSSVGWIQILLSTEECSFIKCVCVYKLLGRCSQVQTEQLLTSPLSYSAHTSCSDLYSKKSLSCLLCLDALIWPGPSSARKGPAISILATTCGQHQGSRGRLLTAYNNIKTKA